MLVPHDRKGFPESVNPVIIVCQIATIHMVLFAQQGRF